ncbi:MAG: hypothetical protein JST27_08030 [Bacteroidetes bacterium]|nr:hypothetical protein [Bacteroidota bacterium]
MGFLEKFLIALSAIALGAWALRLPITPVFLLFGTQGLALFYLFVFPFRKWRTISRHKGWALTSRILSGLVLALGLHALFLFSLGWIQRADIFGNACILLAVWALVQGLIYWRQNGAFAFEAAIRALVLLVLLLGIACWMKPFPIA